MKNFSCSVVATIWIFGVAVVVLLDFSGCSTTPPATDTGLIFRVADYGAKGDGITDDSAAIRSAIAAAMRGGKESVVEFAARRYRVSAEAEGDGKYCFSLRGATGVTLRGVAGLTELISSNPRVGMVGFRSCKNVRLKGITIDYDPVPFIQGGITAVDVERGVFELKVDEGYPEPQPEIMNFQRGALIGKWGIVIDRQTRCFKPGTPSFMVIRTFTALGGRRWRLALDNPADAQKLAIGDAFALRGGGLNVTFEACEGHCVVFERCDGGSIEDVTIYAAPGFCMAFLQCEGDLLVRRVTVCPRPGTTRLLSGNADGVHCQMVRKGVVVEGCHFEGMTDDGMNTYDKIRMVTEVISPTELRVDQTFDMRLGDRIQVLDPKTGFVRGEANVSGVTGRRITMDCPIEGVRTSTNLLTGIVTMSNQLDADVVFNLSTCGAGYIVRSNYFGKFRGRGLLLSGVNGLVEGNIFERASGQGISIANEPHWPEGPMPHDVVIRGNQFRSVGLDMNAQSYGAIMVMGIGLNGVSSRPAIKNIRIEKNIIINPPALGIFLQSCSGVTLTGDYIYADASRTLVSSTGVALDVCSNVVISGLSIDCERPNISAGISIAATVASGENGVKISGLKAKLPPTATLVLDRRATAAAETEKLKKSE